MSGGKVTLQEIQTVQNLIEKCLTHYMAQQEVTKFLLDEMKIEPTFTELVWQRLEQQNPDFFSAYHKRMMLKQQITEFNKLLEQQADRMKVTRGVSLPPMSNGSHLPQRNHSAAFYTQGNSGPTLWTERREQHVTSTNLPKSCAFTNYGSSISQSMPSGVGMPVHSRRIDVSSNIEVPQNKSNVGMVNGEMIKAKAVGYGSRFMHGASGNVLDAIGDTPVSSFSSSVDSDSQPMNESPFDDMPSLGLYGNFSITDLAEFAHSSGLLDSYPESPYRENLLESHGGIKEHHGKILLIGYCFSANKKGPLILMSMSVRRQYEGLTYEDFSRV